MQQDSKAGIWEAGLYASRTHFGIGSADRGSGIEEVLRGLAAEHNVLACSGFSLATPSAKKPPVGEGRRHGLVEE